MLLALCSTIGDGRARSDLEEILAADADEAAELTGRLLADPHPLVGCAVGLWDSEEEGITESFLAWKRGLPSEVQIGGIPTQAELDLWAERNTMGIIRTFPVEVDPLTVLIMASALATRVTWPIPFDTVPAGELGAASSWSTSLHRALRSPKLGVPQWQFIADTTRAGRVAVHVADAEGGLRVVSVIAAEDVAALDVIGAAYAIATDLAELRAYPTRRSEGGCSVRSLFDLPLGEEPRWVITEEPAEVRAADGREEQYWTTLPAWSAQTLLELNDASVGFPTAASAMREGLGLDTFASEARQVTSARYSSVGFEAASITAMMLAMGIPTYRHGFRRNAHLRFAHPYAAVAVSQSPVGGRVSLWHGLPVFSAWITQPEDANDAPST